VLSARQEITVFTSQVATGTLQLTSLWTIRYGNVFHSVKPHGIVAVDFKTQGQDTLKATQERHFITSVSTTTASALSYVAQKTAKVASFRPRQLSRQPFHL
jgi:hypothetical protein